MAPEDNLGLECMMCIMQFAVRRVRLRDGGVRVWRQFKTRLDNTGSRWDKLRDANRKRYPLDYLNSCNTLGE